MTEHEMPGHQWNELKAGGRTLASRYKMSGIPYFVLIAPDGKILEIWKGYRMGVLKRSWRNGYLPCHLSLLLTGN